MTLEILTSDALSPLRHGFFTRRGGASSGIFAGLNCGFGSTDQREAVTINRTRVADAMEVSPENLRTVHQVHSATVVIQGHTPPGRAIQADAMVTDRTDVALAILTADCMPVLLADAQAGIVGAAHAGWRGAVAGVLSETVASMVALGARRDRITAVIGPAISLGNYEVGPDLRDAVLSTSPGADRFFRDGEQDRFQFDLTGYGLDCLRSAGVARAEWIGACTYGDPGRFYSYRRATHRREADYGRLISVIRAQE